MVRSNPETMTIRGQLLLCIVHRNSTSPSPDSLRNWPASQESCSLTERVPAIVFARARMAARRATASAGRRAPRVETCRLPTLCALPPQKMSTGRASVKAPSAWQTSPPRLCPSCGPDVLGCAAPAIPPSINVASPMNERCRCPLIARRPRSPSSNRSGRPAALRAASMPRAAGRTAAASPGSTRS